MSLKKGGNFELTMDAEGNLKNVEMKIAFVKAGNGNFKLIEYTNKDLNFNQSEIFPWHIGAEHIAFQIKRVKEFYNKYKHEINFLYTTIHSIAED